MARKAFRQREQLASVVFHQQKFVEHLLCVKAYLSESNLVQSAIRITHARGSRHQVIDYTIDCLIAITVHFWELSNSVCSKCPEARRSSWKEVGQVREDHKARYLLCAKLCVMDTKMNKTKSWFWQEPKN